MKIEIKAELADQIIEWYDNMFNHNEPDDPNYVGDGDLVDSASSILSSILSSISSSIKAEAARIDKRINFK